MASLDLPRKLGALAEHTWFQGFIIAVILLAAVLVGLETYPGVMAEYGHILLALDKVVLGIFIVEILIKMGAEGRRPWRFFRDPWNVFDFVIVAAAFVPAVGPFSMVLRLARLLRVLRLVRTIPRLQILVGALLKSIPSMFYVSVLLVMLFYMYAVASVFLFAGNDPMHFGNLQLALLSLFRTVTLEDWTDLMYIQMYGCDVYGYWEFEELCTAPRATPLLGALFFVSFVLVGTMIVLNLFIGVVVNGMDEAQREEEVRRIRLERTPPPTLAEEIRVFEDIVLKLQEQLDHVRMAADVEIDRLRVEARATAKRELEARRADEDASS